MTDKHTQWKRVGTAVYIPGGGFDVRYCPDPEELASHIVKCVNYHDRLVEALREVVTDCEAFGCATVETLNDLDALLAQLDTKKESE